MYNIEIISFSISLFFGLYIIYLILKKHKQLNEMEEKFASIINRHLSGAEKEIEKYSNELKILSADTLYKINKPILSLEEQLKNIAINQEKLNSNMFELQEKNSNLLAENAKQRRIMLRHKNKTKKNDQEIF